MDDLSVTNLLLSEKPTFRRRGREEVERLVRDDIASNGAYVPSRWWWDIMFAVIQWEARELQYAAKKATAAQQLYANAPLVRLVLLHGSSLCHFSHLRVAEMVSHSLRILHDNLIPAPYKDEHREILADLLRNCKFSYYLALEELVSLLNYLKVAAESPTIAHRSMHRLLRAYPSTLYRDLLRSGLIEPILEFYLSLLDSSANPSGSSNTRNQAIVAVAELFTTLLSYYGKDSVDLVCFYLPLLLKMIPRALVTIQPGSKDSLYQLLCKFSSVVCSDETCSVLRHGAILRELFVIFDALSNDESLRASAILLHQAATGGSAASRLGRDGRAAFTRSSIASALDDFKLVVHFDALAGVARVIYFFFHYSTPDQAMSMFDDRVNLPLDGLLKRISEAVTMLNDDGHLPTATQAGRTQLGTTNFTQASSSGRTRMHNMSGRFNSIGHIAMGLCLLVSRIAHSNPVWWHSVSSKRGRLLGSDAVDYCSSNLAECIHREDVVFLCDLIRALSDLLLFSAQSSLLDKQILGIVVITLSHLLPICNNIWEQVSSQFESYIIGSSYPSYDVSNEDTNIVESLCCEDGRATISNALLRRLRIEWFRVFQRLLTNVDPWRCSHSNSISNQSFVAEVTTLIAQLLQGNIIDCAPTKSLFQSYVDRSNILLDPRYIECPQIFVALNVIIEKIPKCVPRDLHLRLLERDVFCTCGDVDSFLRERTFDRETCSVGVASYMIGWLEAVRVGPRQIQRQVLNIMEMSNIMFRFFSAGLDASKVNSKYILDQSLRDILKVDSWLPLENNDSYKQLPPEYSTYLTELYESSSFGSIHESSAPPELKIPIIDADAMQILNSYANIFLNQNFVFEEKADGVSNGMLTALGLLIVLCVAIERSETDSSGSSRVSYAVDSCVCCWRLICAILEECCRKYNASLIKDIDIIDICSVLLQIAPRLVRIERAQNDVANPRMSCVDAMCKLLINVHASGCSKQRAFTSGRGVSGDIVDDMDMIDGFDQENISRQAMSPHVQSVSANNDELWGDDELDPAPTGLGLSSRVSAARSPSSGAKNLPSLRLSPEGMHLFTTITRLMVLCSTLHASHVVAFAVAVLQHGVNVTESVEAFDPSHFHAAPPSISVKSEFELALAQGVADVAPCDVIFGLLLSAWDKEWSGLGYARVLCIVKDLLRASSNLSSSGVLNITFIPKCGDIITGGYKNTGDFLSHLWYIRVCQLIVARELLRMDASAHKEIFASMVLKGLTDIDSRVRYVAGRNLSLIFATFTRNPPAIYRSMVGGLHDWVIAALDDAAAAQLRQYAMSRLLSVVAALSLIAKECDSMAAFVLRDILFLRASCRVYIDSQKDLCSALDNSIFKALRFISSVRNYGSVKYLVQDNLTYILQQWISGKSDQILLQSPYPLKLFPLAIVGINSDFKAALPMIASYLIPAVCIADASEKRWMLLSELCQDADIASNDANIAKLLLDNMVAILALDAMRAAMKSQHPNNSVSDDYARNFILRIVDTSELKRREKNHVRLVIRDIFLMPTSWNIKGLDDGSANDTSVEDIIWRALRSCTKSIDSTSSKSHQQNAHTAKLLRTGGIGQHLFEIVSILISRAKDTRLIWVVDGICAAASVLMDVFLPISLSSTNPVSGLADGMQHASILFVLCQELLGNPSVVPRYSALILLEKHVKHMVDLSDVLQSCSIETNDPLVDCFRSLIDDIYCCVYALRNFICLASDDEYLSGTFGNIRLKASDINAETELLGALFPISCSLVAKFAVPSRWNIASLDISNDDSQISKCLSMLVKMTSQYCESILWGFPYSRTTIRMLLCQLNSALSICSASHETYSKFGLMLASHEVDEEERRSLASDAWGLVPRELLASLVACVISLISKFHNNHTPEHKAILRLTHILLGKIGSPNARKVSHNDTRVKFDIFGPDGYDAYAASHLKLRFIYSLLTSSLLSNMESAKKALVILLRLFRSNCLAGAISENLGFTSCVYYRRFQLDKIFGKEPYDIGSESLHPLLKMIQLPFPKVKSSLIEYVWDPRGKSFESWLPFFMIVLLNNMSSRGSPYSIASPELEFFTTVAPVFPEFSNATELLLPVLLEALIEHSPSESIRSTLSQNFEACFLILNWDVSQSINKLGCKFLWYIFQKKKREFLQHPTLPASGRGRKRKAGADDGDMTGSVSARYGYVLKIDPFRIASVSASCGFLGMANAFIEYFTISEDSDRYANKNISSLLVKLSSDLHDNDFIFGIPQTESSLDVEGLIFSHSGKWREALSTYESALSAQRTSTNTASSNSSNLVTDALKGLGFNHVLSSYRRTTDLDDISRSASDSVSKYRNDLSSWDAFDHVVSSIDKQPSTSLLRVRESTEILSKRLSVHDDEDTFARVTPLMLNIQQLYEVEEALSIINCSQTSSLVRPGVASVFERWRNRMEATQGSSSLGIDVLSARLRFVDRMMRSHVLKPVEALACFQQFQQLATTSDMVHSFSPLLFSFISNLDRSSIVSNDSIEIILKRLVQIESKLCESIFLWNKSLGDMALSALKGNVIQPIRESLSALLTEIQTSSKGRTSGSASLIQQQQSLVVRLRHNLSISYLLGGQWLAAKKNIPGMAVINDYMQLAVDFAEEHHQKMLALKTLGHYNHKLYVNIRNRMASPEWIQGMQLALDRQQELDRCKTQARALQAITKRSATEEQEFRNMLKHLRVLQKEIEIDVAEKQVAESSAHQHLLQAITNFGSVLSESSSSDVDIVFLLISLWFENQTNTEVNRYVGGIVDSTKSFKFVSLSYQILSRISAEGLPDGSSSRNRAAMPESESFSSNIVRLASKLCIDHPYHIIPQLLALANEDYIPLQKTPSNASSRSSLWKGLSSSDPSSNQRIIAAKTILSQSGKLTSRSKINFKSIVDSLNALTEDYICLAFASTDQFIKSNRFSGIPLIELGSVFPRFTSLGSDHLCPVISKTINIRSDADYSDVVKLVKFLPNFSITESGITRPKIISCVGSDGVVYKQLVKGNDDLRQDAVMEQVFEHVNIMFQRSDVTNSKDLRIRTYKVVPMTRQCGVVEWVNNTIPFGSYLIDKITGAHARYYPDDLGHAECRRIMQGDVSSDDAAAGAKTKEDLFTYVCSKFHPVFRYFFLERYNDPAQWLGRRVTYTRSVAAVSMIGYVLGIGDRHSHNILVDTATAEVVHIDFGIMFEQGKVLGCPETVPFRLTRDVVDGMGITGVEGSFRRCCEASLQVLRDNQQRILTILEVVIHDPLYKWTLSPKIAKQRQRTEHDEGNFRVSLRAAEPAESSVQSSSRDAGQRTLLRVRNKLQGHDDPCGDTFTVQGQVEYLLQEAQSVSNLSKLFPGWAPWL